ncbi:gephyrin-like molybdotransferase Glp [Crenobacter cavernae]|uniref:Molybdopterin molybdenumtransferase n=1 Tax=Crenobacter cavernae TaxID=2290923 RepID=A0A345Y842_9NEIS|nr:gephyrin-like molybdotransferase Glp [Crenobacter cavernae]AXK40094.1 molybdopterin molybdenumtransferase MoeA [Crenobacter cavernae]
MQSFLDVNAMRAWLDARATALAERDTVELLAGLGRILAEDLVSTLNVPPHDNSAMDGYAVSLAELGQPLPVSQRIPAGVVPKPLAQGTVARIFTGAPIPAGADLVVMQEVCTVGEDGRVTIAGEVKEGQNIRRAGSDIATGAVVVPAGKRLTPADLGLLASIGIAEIDVLRPLRVAVFFTGDELTEPGEPLADGKIYNSNRYWLTPLLLELGCEVSDLGIVPDSLEATREALSDAADFADIILTCGGVSVGEEDHVKAAVESVGELNLWKIAIKPGKPFAFGRIGAADFVGLPGNPVSGYVTFHVFVRRFIEQRQGLAEVREPTVIKLKAAFEWSRADSKREEYLRVKRTVENGETVLARFANQNSGVLSSCAWADGLVRLAPGQTVAPGDWVDYLPFE